MRALILRECFLPPVDNNELLELEVIKKELPKVVLDALTEILLEDYEKPPLMEVDVG